MDLSLLWHKPQFLLLAVLLGVFMVLRALSRRHEQLARQRRRRRLRYGADAPPLPEPVPATAAEVNRANGEASTTAAATAPADDEKAPT